MSELIVLLACMQWPRATLLVLLLLLVLCALYSLCWRAFGPGPPQLFAPAPYHDGPHPEWRDAIAAVARQHGVSRNTDGVADVEQALWLGLLERDLRTLRCAPTTADRQELLGLAVQYRRSQEAAHSRFRRARDSLRALDVPPAQTIEETPAAQDDGDTIDPWRDAVQRIRPTLDDKRRQVLDHWLADHSLAASANALSLSKTRVRQLRQDITRRCRAALV